jgi:nucleotide-binding universal stress UspA family protein
VTALAVVDARRLGNVGPVPLGGARAAADLRAYRLKATCEQIEETIEQLKVVCQESRVPVDIRREQGDPIRLMLAYARYHDLAVFGLHSMFEHDVLGDCDVDPARVLKRLIAGGVKPLIAVSGRPRQIRRVLLAFSGSVKSAESIQQFVRLRLWPDITVRILVCDQPREQAEHLLNEATIYCRAHGYDPETCYRPGHPKREILAEAEGWDADIVVIGSDTSSRLTSVFWANTMLHVLRHSERSLFIGA